MIRIRKTFLSVAPYFMLAIHGYNQLKLNTSGMDLKKRKKERKEKKCI